MMTMIMISNNERFLMFWITVVSSRKLRDELYICIYIATVTHTDIRYTNHHDEGEWVFVDPDGRLILLNHIVCLKFLSNL